MQEFVDLWDLAATVEVHTGKEREVQDFNLKLVFLVLPQIVPTEDISYQSETTGSGSSQQLPMIVPNPYLHLQPQSTTGNMSPSSSPASTEHHDDLHAGPYGGYVPTKAPAPAVLVPVSEGSSEKVPSLDEEYFTVGPAQPGPVPVTCPPHYVAMCEAIGSIIPDCHLLHDPAQFVISCKAQICRPGLTLAEAEAAVCGEAEDYADVCRGEEICGGWRDQPGLACPPPQPCPAHSDYSDCGPGCERTCHSDLSCRPHTQPGCYCRPGYVMVGGTCQLEQEVCPPLTLTSPSPSSCSHNNTVWLNHQTWRPDPCTNCSCQGNSNTLNTKTHFHKNGITPRGTFHLLLCINMKTVCCQRARWSAPQRLASK